MEFTQLQTNKQTSKQTNIKTGKHTSRNSTVTFKLRVTFDFYVRCFHRGIPIYQSLSFPNFLSGYFRAPTPSWSLPLVQVRPCVSSVPPWPGGRGLSANSRLSVGRAGRRRGRREEGRWICGISEQDQVGLRWSGQISLKTDWYPVAM